MRRRATLTPFNLSFLDIMFCGFGAVVLLVLILNHDIGEQRQQQQSDLRGGVIELQRQLLQGDAALRATQQTVLQGERELVTLREAIAQLSAQREQSSAAGGSDRSQAQTKRAQLERLKRELLALEQQNRQLNAAAEKSRQQGERSRRIVGDGDRQYLTGLKLGGRRTLILLDRSASMLDETLVNVIRLRNMSDAARRGAAKWQRAIASSEWLVANLPRGGRFQLYGFNTEAQALLPGSDGRWLALDDEQQLQRLFKNLKQLPPQGGTSLHNAFAAAARLDPPPDNILLITDGLPTQGARPRSSGTVTAEQRLALFDAALGQLPADVPVNTLLLPMEGDVYAPAAFWQLAVNRNGSFFTPARDWP